MDRLFYTYFIQLINMSFILYFNVFVSYLKATNYVLQLWYSIFLFQVRL